MTQITPSGNTAGNTADNASGVTITLSAEQLEALGLKHLPAEGAEVKLRATASVSRAGDADGDADADAGLAAAGADDDADAAGDPGTPAPALTLHLTGLELTQARKAPDKVLYGGD